MEIVISNIYIFIMALVLANLEIQIEGKNGWAKELPTWRPAKNALCTRLFAKALSGKQLTGYHIAMFLFVFLIFYFPYFVGLPITLTSFLKTTSLLFIFLALWDFLWFICNPNFTLYNFNKHHIWFHSKWCLGVPIDYIFAITISGLIILPLIFQNSQILNWWVINLGLFTAETALVIFFTLYILKLPRWCQKEH